MDKETLEAFKELQNHMEHAQVFFYVVATLTATVVGLIATLLTNWWANKRADREMFFKAKNEAYKEILSGIATTREKFFLFPEYTKDESLKKDMMTEFCKTIRKSKLYFNDQTIEFAIRLEAFLGKLILTLILEAKELILRDMSISSLVRKDDRSDKENKTLQSLREKSAIHHAEFMLKIIKLYSPAIGLEADLFISIRKELGLKIDEPKFKSSMENDYLDLTNHVAEYVIKLTNMTSQTQSENTTQATR